jgi:hypothetical protein
MVGSPSFLFLTENEAFSVLLQEPEILHFSWNKVECKLD